MNRFLTLLFNVRRYGEEIGYVMRGDMYLDLSPFAAVHAGAQVGCAG
jgi:hypothetical protein